MPVIPKPVMYATVHCSTLGSTFSNVLIYEPPTGITSTATMNAVANGMFSTFNGLYAACMYSGGSVDGINATYNDGTNEYQGFSIGSPTAGALANGPVGDEVAVVLRKQTNFVGRSQRGRWFLGGLDNSVFSSTNPNEIDNTYLNACQTLVAALVSDQTWDGLLFHARHWDRKTNSLVVIAAGAVSSRLATQRARRRHSPDFAE
jgi:hypothetical protein